MTSTLQPDNSTPASGGQDVASQLRSAWHRQRRFVHLRGLCHVLIAGAVLLCLDFVLDWTLVLSGPGRIVLLCANAALLLFVGYWSWWRHLQPFNPVQVALKVERLYPELQSVLVSHVQLADESRDLGGASRGLVRAMSAQAIERARPLDFGRIVDFRSLRAIGVACLITLLVVIGGSVKEPQLLSVFLARMSNPGSRQHYPTRTSLELLSQDQAIAEGGAVSLAARVGGEMPAEAVLTIWPAEGDVETVRLAPSNQQGKVTTAGTRDFVHPINEVYRSFTYAFRAGDAVSDKVTVSVVPPPRIAPRLTVTYPQYTHHDPTEADALNVEVLEGSDVQWQLQSDRPLSVAELIPEGGQSVAMTLSADGKTLGHKQVAGKSLSYSFRWTDREHGFVFAPATRYLVRVVPDRPPRVSLIAPTRDDKATVRKELNLVFSAKDDYGLSTARLVYAVDRRQSASGDAPAEQFIPIATYRDQPRDVTGAKFHWSVAESIPDLKPGEVVQYAVEVQDNRPGSPGKTRSESRRLIIVTKEEYVRLFNEERNRLYSRIKELHGEETRAVDAVRDLKEMK
ncbi:MAG: DUF4175 domain-containing protein [Planctomycetia bacterium]|nr:DUF4175 domain-containing protein [Planctomycetia bacterium]